MYSSTNGPTMAFLKERVQFRLMQFIKYTLWNSSSVYEERLKSRPEEGQRVYLVQPHTPVLKLKFFLVSNLVTILYYYQQFNLK